MNESQTSLKLELIRLKQEIKRKVRNSVCNTFLKSCSLRNHPYHVAGPENSG